MTTDDTAALIAEARFYSAKARRVMEEINADPPQYVDYLDRLTAALERAQADAARMRNALQYARNLIGPDEIVDAALEPRHD